MAAERASCALRRPGGRLREGRFNRPTRKVRQQPAPRIASVPKITSFAPRAGPMVKCRLGGAIAGHHGRSRLHLKAWGCSLYSGGEAQRLRSHREAVVPEPRRAKVTHFAAFDHAGGAQSRRPVWSGARGQSRPGARDARCAAAAAAQCRRTRPHPPLLVHPGPHAVGRAPPEEPQPHRGGAKSMVKVGALVGPYPATTGSSGCI